MKRFPDSVDHLAVTLASLLDTPRVLADLQRQVADLTDAVRAMHQHLSIPFWIAGIGTVAGVACQVDDVLRG
jgi:hypothetical protein